ncbi:penicillin-binding transpeptidase domain-containing protein [Thermobispora bispora]|uniref:NTF2 domain protein transpeptidase n=1 Tax=Thermobispora bispora (strain ATCC 19993 / DSM 43833 / CBS 139.67 / JCM 10125 / KCTC 9307 / NBRC 14880 / R51) TaxID=469371 RepID=D6Y6E8_THEBD|nr:penicillin-binding transpeptidase domain-containing protein [Thermobispora bispora]ADG87520.1 NTF2 domain protein transpeptidase [Thermobispora bispora DSM 43833]
MSAHARAVRAALALGLAVPLLTGCLEESSPHEAVREFLVGWQTGDYASAARRADANPATVRKALADAKQQLDAASIRFSIKGITRDGDTARADFHAEVDLGENTPLWEYDGSLPLRLVGGRWKVRWSPSVIHPDLRPGQRFAVATKPQGRQPILDRHGDPLQNETVLYVAGVYPAEIKDPERLCGELSRVTGFAQDRLLSRIRSAPPKDFVALATFGRTKYAQIHQRLRAIQGIRIVTDNAPVAPKSPTQIVGRVSAITPEAEQALGGPQRAGDSFGREGLQRAYQDQLTGTTETSVVILDAQTGRQIKELQAWRPVRKPTPVQTTIDSRLQSAADAAVVGPRPAALVAVQASTGHVLAVATNQLHQERDALAGRYPAGSVFSIVAADALLRSGFNPEQRVPCTPERSVGGARFQEPGVLTLQTPTFRTDFAQGCVTALASLARRVDGEAIRVTAARYGIGVDWELPLRTFSGSLPRADSDAAVARIIAGQTVQVSPLAMALVAAAVNTGTWRPPVLVTSPSTLPEPSSDGARRPEAQPVRLDPGTVTKLRELMRAGVTSGMARAAAAPGGAVHGVAGLADHIEGKKRTSLSWFVGWQGDVAVAVMAASDDKSAAAAIAGSFFRNARVRL